MSTAKQKIKAILKEEMEMLDISLNKQVDVLEKLLKSIKDLDVSIDYLSAAVTGDAPLAIGLSQATLGRLAAVSKAGREVQPAVAPKKED